MLNIRTRIQTDLNLSKRIRSRIRSENIRTVFIPTYHTSHIGLWVMWHGRHTQNSPHEQRVHEGILHSRPPGLAVKLFVVDRWPRIFIVGDWLTLRNQDHYMYIVSHIFVPPLDLEATRGGLCPTRPLCVGFWVHFTLDVVILITFECVHWSFMATNKDSIRHLDFPYHAVSKHLIYQHRLLCTAIACYLSRQTCHIYQVFYHATYNDLLHTPSISWSYHAPPWQDPL